MSGRGSCCDPYFSATKLEWLLARTDVSSERLAFGTVDTWLVWKLTGGAAHVTDVTNASRTMLLDLEAGRWDAGAARALRRRPRACCRRWCRRPASSAEASLLGATVPVAGIAGDQQAALFGQACFAAGAAKATYGTGTFVLANLGESRCRCARGAAEDGGRRRGRAPPAVRRRGRRARRRRRAPVAARRPRACIESAAESARRWHGASTRRSGVFFVPALTGLGSPQWDPEARGLDLRADPGDDARPPRAGGARGDRAPGRRRRRRPAARGRRPARRRRRERERLPDAVPGRPDREPVEVAADAEATALGAAALAGLAVGVWPASGGRGAAAPAGAVRAPDRARRRESGAGRSGGEALRRATVERLTWVIAHRGASCGGAREHAAGVRAGDRARRRLRRVRRPGRGDGGLVVFHDLRLDRLTPATRAAPRRPLGELRELGIPTLEEVLELTAGRIGVMAELKSPWLYRAPRHRRAHGRAARAATRSSCSFSRRAMLETRQVRPGSADRPARRLRDSIRAAAGFAWAVGFGDPRVTARGIAQGPRARSAGARLHGQRAEHACSRCRARRRRRSSLIVRIELAALTRRQAEQPGAVRREAATTRVPTVSGAACAVETSAVSIRSPLSSVDPHPRLAPRNVCEIDLARDAPSGSAPLRRDARPSRAARGRARARRRGSPRAASTASRRPP